MIQANATVEKLSHGIAVNLHHALRSGLFKEVRYITEQQYMDEQQHKLNCDRSRMNGENNS